MVVANQNTAADTTSGFFVHPVVEINLRRTMGHVALSLSKEERFQQRMMRVDYDGSHYHCTRYTRNSGFKSFLSDGLVPYLD